MDINRSISNGGSTFSRNDLSEAIRAGNSYDVTRILQEIAEYNFAIIKCADIGHIDRESFIPMSYGEIQQCSKYNIEYFIFARQDDINILGDILKAISFINARGSNIKLRYTHWSQLANDEPIAYKKRTIEWVPLPREILHPVKLTTEEEKANE